jgi:hypothetical protein
LQNFAIIGGHRVYKNCSPCYTVFKSEGQKVQLKAVGGPGKMRKAILIDENGNASTVWASEFGFGTFELVDSSEVDFTEVYGEVIEIGEEI